MLSLRKMLLPVAALAGVGYLLLHKRLLGDKARIGDDVFVPVDPRSPAAPLLPAGVAQVVVHVTGTSGSDVLTGVITGGALAGAANFLPVGGATPASVNRSTVTAILRNGVTVT